jgi:hypothetical protein
MKEKINLRCIMNKLNRLARRVLRIIIKKAINRNTYFKLIKNLSIAIISILIFFALLEFTLYLFDMGGENDSNESYCCNSEHLFPICHGYARKSYETQYNIFVFGSSSVYNLQKYEEATNGFIQEEFSSYNHIKPNIKFAGLASYGTLRLFPYFKAILECNNPGAIIFYLGNNEFEDQKILEMMVEEKGKRLHEMNIFLERFRFYQLYRDLITKVGEKVIVFSMLNKRLFPRASRFTIKPHTYYWGYLKTEEEKERVALKYEENLDKMIKYAKMKGVKVILSTIPNNIEHAPAGSLNFFEKSDLYESTAPRIGYWKVQEYNKKELVDLLMKGMEYIEQGELGKAKKIYIYLRKKINEKDPFLEYYLGRYYLKQEKYNTAEIHFSNANDLDADPHHAYSSINEKIISLAEKNDIALIDFYSILKSKAPNGILGKSLFSDHVHLNALGEKIWLDTFEDQFVNLVNEYIKEKENSSS